MFIAMANDTHRGRSSGVATRRATHNDKTCDWGGYPESGPEQASRSIVPPAECGNKTPPPAYPKTCQGTRTKGAQVRENDVQVRGNDVQAREKGVQVPY